MAPRRSWAKANNPFWSKHVAAWYRSALEAEHYCRKHDLSTTSLMRWARHLVSADDLRKRENICGICLRKRRNGSRGKRPRSAKGGLGVIVTACARTTVRLRFRRSGACMSKR